MAERIVYLDKLYYNYKRMSDQKIKNSGESFKLPNTETPEILGDGNIKEQEIIPEFTSEQKEKIRSEILDEIESVDRQPAPNKADKAAVAAPLPPVKSQSLIQIENILAEDLQDTFYQMDPDARERFKAEGEKTASKIEALLLTGKGKVGTIFKLIIKWLKLIPGVNKFFIRQEAKIKTSKIINLGK